MPGPYWLLATPYWLLSPLLFDPSNPPITARQLASAWGVTPATIRNWEKEGMEASGKNAEGVKVWAKADAEKWRAVHRPPGASGGIHGGKREGAGRRDAAANGQIANGQMAKGEKAVGGSGGEEEGEGELPNIGGIKLDTPLEIFAAFRAGTLTERRAKGLKDAVQAAAARMELDVKEGKLMDASAVEGAWGRHLQAVRRRFEALTRTTTPRLLTALGLGPEHGAAVREVLKGEVDAVLDALCGDAFGEAGERDEETERRRDGGDGDAEDDDDMV